MNWQGSRMITAKQVREKLREIDKAWDGYSQSATDATAQGITDWFNATLGLTVAGAYEDNAGDVCSFDATLLPLLHPFRKRFAERVRQRTPQDAQAALEAERKRIRDEGWQVGYDDGVAAEALHRDNPAEFEKQATETRQVLLDAVAKYERPKHPGGQMSDQQKSDLQKAMEAVAPDQIIEIDENGVVHGPLPRLYTEAEVRERERAARLDGLRQAAAVSKGEWAHKTTWGGYLPCMSWRIRKCIAELQAEYEKTEELEPSGVAAPSRQPVSSGNRDTRLHKTCTPIDEETRMGPLFYDPEFGIHSHSEREKRDGE